MGFKPLPAMTVMNLSRSRDRLTDFRRRSGVGAEAIPRLSAIDGQKLNLKNLCQQGLLDSSALHWPRGQLGCALSHVKALLHCQHKRQPLLVFEDDALFAPTWQQQLGQLMDRAPRGWELLLLGWNMDSCLQVEWAPGQSLTALFQPKFSSIEVLEQALADAQGHQWFRLRKGLGLAGYVVSPAGADRILEWGLPLRTLLIEPSELPSRPCFSFDGQLNSFYPSLSAWACMPPLVLGANEKPQSLTAS